MSEREKFETLFLILYKKWRKYGKHTSAYGVGWDIWQQQQKKIDDLQLKLAIKNDMITALNLTIDELKSLNPDVPCPVCGGGIDKAYKDDKKACCLFCNYTGTVPLTKAQEYRIRELEREMAKLKSEIGCINSKPKISQNTTSGKWTDRMIEEAR